MTDAKSFVSQLDLSAEEEFQLHIERGRRALNGGNLIEAKAEIDRCLAARPDDSSVLNLRALLLFKLEEYDDAIVIFERLVEQFPDEHVLLTSLGLAYLKKEEYEGAAARFERAIKLDHNYTRAHNYLGFCYQNLGRYQDAKEEFLLGGSRSMAAKMEEARLQAASEAEAEANSEQAEKDDVQDAIDSMINEPEPEKPSFVSVEREKVDASEAVASAPVLRNLADVTAQCGLAFPNEGPCTLSSDGILRVKGAGFTRLRDTLIYTGDLELRPRFKRYKGKDLKTSFGSEQDPIHELVGDGVLYCKPSGLLTLIPVDDEVVYLQEDRVWAFGGDLRWENGRLPGKNGGDLLLVQFKGTGAITLRLKEPLRVLTVTPEQSALLPASDVVGWCGEVVPRLVAMTYPGKEGTLVAVEVKGNGQVLFELPHSHDDDLEGDS